jgi:guanylate kinase
MNLFWSYGHKTFEYEFVLMIKKTKNLCVSVSHTTRAARPGEVHGKNYFFVSKNEFNEINNNNARFKEITHWAKIGFC